MSIEETDRCCKFGDLSVGDVFLVEYDRTKCNYKEYFIKTPRITLDNCELRNAYDINKNIYDFFLNNKEVKMVEATLEVRT